MVSHDKNETDNTLISPLEAFYQRIKTEPDTLCFVQPVANNNISEYSWSRVDDEVRRMASYLKSLDLPPKSHIALFSKNCAHWIMADLAIWMAGHISVPLYPTLNPTTIQQIIQHSSCAAIFVGKLDNWEDMGSGIDESLPRIAFPSSPNAVQENSPTWQQIVIDSAPLPGYPKPSLDELATIIYTSGTTGKPKGVMHSFRTMAVACLLGSDLLNVGNKDRILSYLPLAHVTERATVELGQLYLGFTVYFAHSLDTFPDDLRRAKPTLFFAVPRIWVKLQQQVLERVPARKFNLLMATPIVSMIFRRKLMSQLGLEKVRLAISGAAPLSSGTLQWYNKCGLKILEGYGMSENFAYSHSSRADQPLAGSVGQANPQVECRIADSGEILVRTPTNMLGYYKDPEASQAAFDQDGYFRTGDIGEIDNHGHLKITGRIKELFKTSKGKYVAPAPIENRLLSNPYIEQACVTGASLTSPIALVNLSEASMKKLGDKTFRHKIENLLKELTLSINQACDKHERLACLIVVTETWGVENNFTTPTLKLKRNFIDDFYGKHYQQWALNNNPVIFADH